MKDVTREDHPHDELTELCDDMLTALDAHPNGVGVQAIVMLRKETRSGIGMHGYDRDDPQELLHALFQHVEAILASYGAGLNIITIPRSNPEDN